MGLNTAVENQIDASYSNDSIHFRDILENIFEILFENGKSVKPYNDRNLKIFSRLNLEQQKKVTIDATVYLETLGLYREMSAEQGGQNVTIDEGYRTSMWSALKYFGLRPTSDLFNYLTHDKIVEVYDNNGIQIWRNFNFFNVCGYSLEEMFCYTWMERYARNEEVMAQIGALMVRLMSSNRETIQCDIRNELRELKSSERLVIDAHHEYISPLYSAQNTYAGFAVITSAKIIARLNQATSLDSNMAVKPNSEMSLI